MEQIDTSVSRLPTEILLKIFKTLPGNQLPKCREVSVLWKDIVESDDIWREICKREYKTAVSEAIPKCHPSLTWRSLYKSFCLWPKLASARETWHEFANHEDPNRKIKAVSIRNGAAVVHSDSGIEYSYYDLGTLEQTDSLTGNFKKYDETDFVLVLLEQDNKLKIIRKSHQRPVFDNVVEVDNVTDFKIVNKDVYYLEQNEETANINVCKFCDDYKSTFINRIKGEIWGFRSSGNNFEVMTKNFKIYTLSGQEFVLTQFDARYNIDSEGRVTKNNDYMLTFNFFDNFNCFKEFITRYVYSAEPTYKNLSNSYIYHDAASIRIINRNILLVGTTNGKVRIYVNFNENFDPVNPTREYRISDCTNNSTSCINGVDMVEAENGHVVVLSTSDQVFALNLVHV